MLRTASIFIMILASSILLDGCRAESQRPKRIVLITLDTLRLDAMPPGRPFSTTMPLTRAWANSALLFSRHYSATSTTQPTHASLLTGMHPWRHGVTRNGQILGKDVSTLPERLQLRGFETAAVVASFPLHRTFGFDQGFDVYQDEFERDFQGMRAWEGTRVPRGAFYSLADSVTGRALEIVDANRGGDQFFWFHFFDAHAPYGSTGPQAIEVHQIQEQVRRKPERTDEVLASARKLYDDDVRFMDRELNRLLERLEEDAKRFETHVFITSDHGESFGEGGVLAHNSRVSEEQIHVPLIVLSPLVEHGTSAQVVGSVDIAQAILFAAGATEEKGVLFSPEPDPDHRVCGMRQTFEQPGSERRVDDKRVILEGFLFYCVEGGQVSRGNSASAFSRDRQHLKGRFLEFEEMIRSHSTEKVRDRRSLEALRALGYMQ